MKLSSYGQLGMTLGRLAEFISLEIDSHNIIIPPSKTVASSSSSGNTSSTTTAVKPFRFPTSEEIYFRLKTDPVFNQAKVYITYHDSVKQRFVDLPFCQWRSIKDGGDIPWHRVYFIKYDGQIIWNRDTKECIIQQLSQRLAEEESLLEVDLPSSLRLMTWNVLSDLYEKHITNMQLRQDAIFDYIQASACDIICLQEVTNDFFNALKERFNGDYQLAKTDLKTNNISIVSKIPFSSFQIVELNLNKQILSVHFAQQLIVSIVHLTSNYQSDKQHGKGGGSNPGNVITKRNLQLSQLLQHLSTSSNPTASVTASSVILGDFNTTDNVDILTNASYREVTVPDFTYNPETNRFAKLMSLTQRQEKYDRCFYRSSAANPTSLNATSCIVDTENKLSDHYPVLITLEYNAAESELSSLGLKKKRILSTPNKYSLSIVIPVKFWKLITTISHHYEMNWKKWMPHVHLFFPFLDLLSSDEKALLQQIVSQRKYSHQTTLKVDKLAYFTHHHYEGGKASTTYTVYADFTAENQAMLKELHSEISDALNIQVFSPDADGSDVSEGYHPHLTLASMDSLEGVQRFIQANQKLCQTIEFPLRRLCYLHSRSTSEQQYYDVIDLFGQKSFEGNLVEFLLHYLPAGMVEEIKYAGSSVFDADTASSSSSSSATIDYDDLLVIGKVPRDDFIAATLKLLKTCGLFSDVRRIANQHMHYLKLLPSPHQPHLHYDIHYVNKADFHIYNHPSSASHYSLSVYDENSCAVYAASAHIRHLHETEIKAFAKKLHFLKRCAKRCGIYGLHYGFLSGIAYAILLSHFILIRQRKERGLVYDLESLSDEEVAIAFCEYYGREYDHSTLKGIAVPLIKEEYHIPYHHRPDMSPMQIINPVRPYGNVTRTMTRSSFQFILHVFCNHFFLHPPAQDDRLLLEGGGFKKTEVVAYCQNTSQLQLFQNLFDNLYLRMMILFEENGVFPIGSRQAELKFEDSSFHYFFYLPKDSSMNLMEVNTVWSYLLGAAERSFGKEVFVQILSS